MRFSLGPKTMISRTKITISAQVCSSVSNFPCDLNLQYSLVEARLAMGRTKISGLVDDETMTPDIDIDIDSDIVTELRRLKIGDQINNSE